MTTTAARVVRATPGTDPAMTGLQSLDALHGSTTSAAPRDGTGPLMACRTYDGGRPWPPMTIGTVPRPRQTLLSGGPLQRRLARDRADGDRRRVTGRVQALWRVRRGRRRSSWTALASAPCFTSVFGTGGRFRPARGRRDRARRRPTAAARGIGHPAGDGRRGGFSHPPSFAARLIAFASSARSTRMGRPPAGGSSSGRCRAHVAEHLAPPRRRRDAPVGLGVRRRPLARARSTPTTERPFGSTTIEETWDGGRTWTTAVNGDDPGLLGVMGDRLHGLIQGVDIGDSPTRRCHAAGTGRSSYERRRADLAPGAVLSLPPPVRARPRLSRTSSSI